MNKKFSALLAAGLATAVLAGCNSGGDSGSTPSGDSAKGPQGPNILFVIMDDVGIDQMKVFGYGGVENPMAGDNAGRGLGPNLPNIDAVARAGVRFRNTWSMPECSPGRAAFFLGRFPLRTGIQQAIGPNDLATSQVSPYDITAPKLLKRANYESGMFGKFHLAGPENNEAENATPSVLGWDYFYGWVGGLPSSIDTRAGNNATASGTHVCGFVPGESVVGGAKNGACYQPNGSCTVIPPASPSQDAPGLQCLDSGGIFVPESTCGTPPASLDFTRQNAYYVSPLVIIENGDVEVVKLTDPRGRGYRTRIETDAAIDWIKTRPADRAWMATVSYSAPHTPWQQPPKSLVPGYTGPLDNLSCTGNAVEARVIQDRMTEAMDTEFGRLLVETGLATRKPDGSLNYDPKASNTVIVIVGDNGTLASAVKLPFDPTRAKGTAYQTGVWDPLIIAGPQVVEPDREVDHMVNTVDLFQFFGELAGLDAHKEVPRTIDSVGILPYLTNPGQGSLRTINFTMGGLNQQANGAKNGPCVIGTSCTIIPVSKGVCEDNQGVWWGAGYDDPSVLPAPDGVKGYATCAAVNQALYKVDPGSVLGILPESSLAIRNDRFKLVRNVSQDYVPATDKFETKTVYELYEINQAKPTPLLDTVDRQLAPSANAETQAAYNELFAKLGDILASNPDCPGDGNMDGVVNAEDLGNWARIAKTWGLSSVYDFVTSTSAGFFRDGLTNNADEAVIQANLNKTCAPTYGLY